VNNTFAQERGRIFIKADQVISDVLTPEKIYEYSKFTPGKIIFRDHTSTTASLNYNYLSGEIEFINQVNDTLAIAKHQMLNIQRIEVNKDTFYYNDGYLQQVTQIPLGRLVKKEMLIVINKDKLGAYDRSTSTTGAEALTTFRDYFGSDNGAALRVRENITLAYTTKFFFGDNFYTFLPANKKNLLKIFHSKEETINNYLRENNIDFRSLQDLRNLLLFLQ
jgi:hypothetical protein